jgi:hypothetical protein
MPRSVGIYLACWDTNLLGVPHDGKVHDPSSNSNATLDLARTRYRVEH